MWSYNSISKNELYHHGVPGQKWGIRRYQNKDGSLTSTGKKRRTKDEASSNSTNKNKTESELQTRKRAKDMSDDELKTKINRKRLENDYNNLYPEKVSKGKKFADAVVNKVIIPAATEAAKNVAKDFLTQQGKKLVGMAPEGNQNKDKDKNKN